MKTTTLRSFAAPSPAVLSFLRAQVQCAFERSGARCAATKEQAGRYASSGARSGQLGSCFRRQYGTASRNEGFGKLKSAAAPKTNYVEANSSCLSLTTTRNTACAPLASSSLIHPLSSRRALSTTSSNWWRIWPSNRQQRTPLNSTHQHPLSGLADDAASAPFNLGRVTRPANELKMRCTELDENGSVTMVSGEFKKSELIAKYGLLPRDLRKIDSSLLPHILVRPSAILINLLHLRVLIKHNRVLVFDAYGTTDSKSQSIFMYDLDLKLRQKESVSNGTLAYEFRALEAVLISVTAGLEEEFEGVSKPVVKVLMDLEEDIDRDKLRMLLVYSKKLGSFEQKARLVRDAMTELLEADDDLSAMYLSEKSQGKEREDDDHTEVEMLLESYHKVADEIVQAAENLVSSIRNTEEIVKAILDANRNSLMLLDLRFSILTLAITAGTFVAALYGMNLKNFIEESDLGFFGISAWCTVFGLFVAWYGLIKLRRVQRVSMWGHGGAVPGPRGGSWGLGAWGGKSSHLKDYAPAQGMHMQSFRAGESVSDIIQRERAFSRRLSKVESRAEEAAKA